MLAVLGREKTFATPLHVGRPNLGDRAAFLRRVEEALDRRWLSNDGPLAHRFEEMLRERLGVTHALVMCNATVALELVIKALGIDGEVIVPAYTFVATAHSVYETGSSPIFADIKPGTHHLNVEATERLITGRTRAIMPVHLWGEPVDVDAFESLAKKHGLKLLFDAAHALGGEHQGRAIGNFGDAEVFSFHATKFVNSGEGGAVTTNDDELARRMRLMRNFGFAGYDTVIAPGTNAKMCEFNAAMGITNLEAMDSFVARNRENHEAYARHVGALPGFRLFQYQAKHRPNYQYVIFEVDEERTQLTRDELVAVLQEENVFARRYFFPGCHRMEPYRTLMPDVHLPETDRVCGSVIAFPTGTAVDESIIAQIADILRRALENVEAVRAAVKKRPAPPLPIPVPLPDLRRHV